MATPSGTDRELLRAQIERERQQFVDTHARSRALFSDAKGALLRGVPMSWMSE